ncbi:MAG: glycosyltransferase family 4 protein [Candidatus Bathyarchaeota archaeon]|nr:glycosyltransferase family 4 protein [Candidatus Bathyarchaeota archaeon]
MKISVFFDLYDPLHENKDLGQIPMGLIENGVNSSVITVTKKALDSHHPKFQVYHNELEEFYKQDFWTKNDSDVIIAYPLQGALYSPLIEKMKLGGKKVLLKFDSDGRFHFPLQRTYFRIPLRERLTPRNILSDLYWRVSPKRLKRRRHTKVAHESIRQIELSDGAIIESPDALANLNYFLTAWGRSDLIKKTHFVPNPVGSEYVEGEIGEKENIVLSFGRWDDFRQKNTRVMAETIVEFLRQRPDFQSVIFGAGTDLVKSFLQDAPEGIKSRIEILGFVEQAKIKELLGVSKIFFVPSRWESFSISSAEALCMGCSIVGTPVEALRYLSMQGFSGSIAPSFHKEAILAALLQDAAKWDNGSYDPQKIALYWRPKLDRKTVAKSIANLVT